MRGTREKQTNKDNKGIIVNKPLKGSDDVIILNKVFEGCWNDKEGNISHEIIDFFKTDIGDYFVYNTPRGTVQKGCEKVKYLILTSSVKKDKNSQEFKLLYYIEIEDKINNPGKYIKKDPSKINSNKAIIKKCCEDNKIMYGGKYLYEIFKDEDDYGKNPLVTFKGNAIYEAKEPILFKIDNKIQYNYWRPHCGYIFKNKYGEFYKNLLEIIKDKNKWNKVNISCVKKNPISLPDKTFLDLILKNNSEECFTNIFNSILSHKTLLIEFIIHFKDKDLPVICCQNVSDLEVTRENKIVQGRMDISGVFQENGKTHSVIIENKIHSGLNGVDKQSASTQLTTYYTWAKNKATNIHCYLLVPDYKKKELDDDIEKNDQQMQGNYKVIMYSELKKFISDCENKGLLKNHSLYQKYSKDILNAIESHSYKDRKAKFEQDFLDAISNV